MTKSLGLATSVRNTERDGSVVIRGARTPSGPTDLLLAHGRIVSTRPSSMASRDGRNPTTARASRPESTGASSDASPVTEYDASELWAVPGWIDLQVNDIDWLARGIQEPATHAERVRDVLRYQTSRGVSGVVLATLAAPLVEIEAYLQGSRTVLDGAATEATVGAKQEEAASLRALDGAFLGVLVEGTFMNPAFHGAHNPRWVLPPDLDVLESFLETGAVRLLNVAPETSRSALELIAAATARDVIVGVGHAKPHAELVREAVAAGLSYVIHLGNGPTGSNWKRFHDGGLLEETLRNDALTATLILDGVHVHPQLALDWMRRKGVERSIGVSDSGFAMGAPEGRFEVFGIRGEAAALEGRHYLRVVPGADAELPNPRSSDAAMLFGSAIEMRDVFENAVRWFTATTPGVAYRTHEGITLDEAIDRATQLTASNPARLLGLADRGVLKAGTRADVNLLRVEGEVGQQRVELVEVWRG